MGAEFVYYPAGRPANLTIVEKGTLFINTESSCHAVIAALADYEAVEQADDREAERDRGMTRTSYTASSRRHG